MGIGNYQPVWVKRDAARRQPAVRVAGGGSGKSRPAGERVQADGAPGFSFLEVAVVIMILAVIVALALPSATNSLGDYRLHSDASDVAGSLNMARMKAASQYAPYRLDVGIHAGTFALERLCGNTPSSGAGSDANCTAAYNPFTAPNYDLTAGTQYLSQGDTLASCLPTGIATYPGTMVANPAGCPASPPDPLQFYFNTRGSPVDGAGSPLTNGGAVLYLKNLNSMVDAVTVSVGGRVSVWNWDVAGAQWYMR